MNPCQTHYGVKIDGYCPICLINERAELQRALEAACQDLNDAHDELLKAQSVPPHQRPNLDWPEWSGPANTLRWAGRLLDKDLGKSRATNNG